MLGRTALRWNALAEPCFAPGEAPRVLWTQRAHLADLAGDAAEAERSRRLADATPIRSLREYSLLALDDPERAAGSDALPALAEASRHAPQDFALWMNLGQCHAFRGRFAEAEDCFTVAIALRPGSPWGYFHRGRVELERRDHGQAGLDFDQALRLRPGLAAAHVNRALARMGGGDAAGAVADLTAALDLGAEETRIYFIRAVARARTGDEAGAARDRAEGLRRTPADAESWVARGLARLPADPAGALADFEAALALDPRCRPALQNKAAVLSDRLGRTGEAIEVLDRAVSLYPDYVPCPRRAGRPPRPARPPGGRAPRRRGIPPPRPLGRDRLPCCLHLCPDRKGGPGRSDPGTRHAGDRPGPGAGLGRGRPDRPGPRRHPRPGRLPGPASHVRPCDGPQRDEPARSLSAAIAT